LKEQKLYLVVNDACLPVLPAPKGKTPISVTA